MKSRLTQRIVAKLTRFSVSSIEAERRTSEATDLSRTSAQLDVSHFGEGGHRYALRHIWLGALVCAMVALALPLSASAKVPIYSFTAQPASNTLQAGAHPDVAFSFEIGNRQQTSANPCDCEDARNVTVHLPTGLIGNPHSTPQCTITQFTSDKCPPDSQVGVTEDAFSADPEGSAYGFAAPVYNLVPPPTEPALLAFETVISTPVFINVSARTNSDYGIDATVSNIDHFLPLTYSVTDIWGVPASPVNSKLRFGLGETPILLRKGENFLCSENVTAATADPQTIYQFCERQIGGEIIKTWHNSPDGGGAVGDCTLLEGGCGGPGFPVSSNSPEQPFFQNPTTCGEGSLATSLDILSYDGSTSHADSAYPPTTNCNELTFNPSQSIEPTTHAADSPSGAEFRLTVPQFESPSVPSPSELKAAVVTLPKGFTLAPNVTNGKLTCSEAEAQMGAYASTEEGHCPEDSKIGTISVETPVLPGPLDGAVYLGEPKPGNRFRLFLLFDGFGVHIKLAGTATPDPVSGQIHISFQNLPQAPFESFNMHIFGAERGSLDTPTQCGKYEVTSEWTPWDSALSNQTSRQFFTIDEGPNGSPCPNGPRPFHPGFQATATANTGGAHTDFWLNLLREDGEQNLSGLTVTTPSGFAATLKGLTYCPDSAIAAAALESHLGIEERSHPSCPASSYVGELTAGGGPGSHPLYLPGKAYLAGPYKGAPLSFVFITPAVSGGYDLGDVVIRVAVHVNPETAQVTTVSDPLPQIYQGIPLRLRQVFVDLNRPGFALNPTDCEPLSVTAQVSGDEGAAFTATQPFQVANCAALPFKPSLALVLSGSTKQAGNPALTATLTTTPGEANISRTQVTLPHTELVDNAHINDPCTRVQFSEGKTPGEKCPPGSILGFAKAATPLLDKPLEGPVYLRSTGRAGLPDIVAALNGQIDIALDGHVDSVGGRLRTTFETVPDAPVTKFTLSLDGGRKGLIENSPGLCAHTLHVTAAISGQNGKTANQNPVLSTPCGKKHHRRAHLARAGRANRGGGRR